MYVFKFPDMSYMFPYIFCDLFVFLGVSVVGPAPARAGNKPRKTTKSKKTQVKTKEMTRNHVFLSVSCHALGCALYVP